MLNHQLDCYQNVVRTFHTVGIDFIGPFICREREEEVKVYIIIITCALIRAIWLEVTKTMEVDELKEKLNQLISNHIRPSEIIYQRQHQDIWCNGEID